MAITCNWLRLCTSREWETQNNCIPRHEGDLEVLQTGLWSHKYQGSTEHMQFVLFISNKSTDCRITANVQDCHKGKSGAFRIIITRESPELS
jgi:hypothetical protein